MVPAAAIMAALSVQRDNGGIMTFTSGSFANAEVRASLRPLLAATPPARTTCFTPYASAAFKVFQPAPQSRFLGNLQPNPLAQWFRPLRHIV